MGLKKRKAVKLAEVEAESGVKVTVGDDIVIDSGSTMPFVAKVQSVLPPGKKKEKGRLKVAWYYFPEDTTGGRQVFHSKCEIFKSNHEDIVSTQSVMNVCKVLQLAQWCTYHAEGESQRLGKNGLIRSRPFGKAEADTTKKEQSSNAKPPSTAETSAAPSTDKKSAQPPSPKPSTRDQSGQAKGATDNGAVENGSDHRGKRKLPDTPAEPPAEPNRTVRRVSEASPEPEPVGDRDGKAASGKNGSAAGKDGADAGSDAESERESSPMVFLCRHAYDAKRHKWVDEEVPLYCVCCMPYNPDLDMVECSRCGEWFHGECLGMNQEQFDLACQQDDWQCIACAAKPKGRAR